MQIELCSLITQQQVSTQQQGRILSFIGFGWVLGYIGAAEGGAAAAAEGPQFY